MRKGTAFPRSCHHQLNFEPPFGFAMLIRSLYELPAFLTPELPLKQLWLSNIIAITWLDSVYSFGMLQGNTIASD